MRVCKFWAAVGKPHLWRDLNSRRDLVGLLKLLPYEFSSRNPTFTVGDPSALDQKLADAAFRQKPAYIDWEKFIEHSSLVHRLEVSTPHTTFQPRSAIPSILDFISQSRDVADIFPNLETLNCDIGPSDVRQAFSLLHSGVKQWIFNVPQYPYEVSPRSLIPIERLSRLAYLEIGISTIIPHLIPTFVALQDLPCVRTIVLSAYKVQPDILQALSRWPALVKILTRRDSGPRICKDNHSCTPSFDKQSFPALTTLSMSGCPYQLQKLMDNEYLPYHVQAIVVERLRCSETKLMAPIAYKSIVAKFPNITSVVLRDADFSSLRPFLLTYNLTNLTVEPGEDGLFYDSAEIFHLAQSLTRVETLSLGTKNGSFTFNHLHLFSRHCIKLVDLSIVLDPSEACVPIPPEAVPFLSLRVLDLGPSFFDPDTFTEVNGASAILLQLLPNGCKIRSDPTHELLDRTLGEMRDHSLLIWQQT
ncbi:hypothetical protein H0H87_001052 [Tephrocybe sp. NHM501043]|nr:hypothetical protein H0H87_001052 [Tephrocybe sp. NHM501043]